MQFCTVSFLNYVNLIENLSHKTGVLFLIFNNVSNLIVIYMVHIIYFTKFCSRINQTKKARCRGALTFPLIIIVFTLYVHCTYYYLVTTTNRFTVCTLNSKGEEIWMLTVSPSSTLLIVTPASEVFTVGHLLYWGPQK